jgi:molybdopterin-binding protein
MATAAVDCVLYGLQAMPSRVMIAAQSRRHPARSLMKLSARNKLKGKILDVKKGATTAHVRIEIASGQVVTASITNEAVEELGLKAGGTATAIVKASDVMIAVD